MFYRTLTVFVFLLVALNVSAQETLILNTCQRPPYHYENQTGLTDRLLHEAFRRIGKKVIIQALPAERALENANAGIEDGDAGRMEGLEKLYPNLIRVPEVFLSGDLVAFSNKPLHITDWKSLNQYNVAIIRGHQKATSMLDKPASLTEARDFNLLFNLLVNDRADVAVTERLEGLEMLKKLKVSDIKVIEPPLLILDIYVYLHKKHRPLVPMLATTIQEMKKDGTFKLFLDKFSAEIN